MSNGIKEDGEKLDYEIDWEFVKNMAERMAINKGKYPPNNWKKPIELEKLRNALARHFIEVMKGNNDDEGITNGHLIALALNAMMINYQVNNVQN